MDAPATDPWSAAFQAFGPAVTKAVTPGSAQQGGSTFSSPFDSSGWNINFGSGTVNSDSSKQTVPAVAAPVARAMQNPVVMLALVLAVVLYLKKHK